MSGWMVRSRCATWAVGVIVPRTSSCLVTPPLFTETAVLMDVAARSWALRRPVKVPNRGMARDRKTRYRSSRESRLPARLRPRHLERPDHPSPPARRHRHRDAYRRGRHDCVDRQADRPVPRPGHLPDHPQPDCARLRRTPPPPLHRPRPGRTQIPQHRRHAPVPARRAAGAGQLKPSIGGLAADRPEADQVQGLVPAVGRAPHFGLYRAARGGSDSSSVARWRPRLVSSRIASIAARAAAPLPDRMADATSTCRSMASRSGGSGMR